LIFSPDTEESIQKRQGQLLETAKKALADLQASLDITDLIPELPMGEFFNF
jgi:hypothetical protein